MRAFCPAAREGHPVKSLKFRGFAFRAWVMTGKGRKQRANPGRGGGGLSAPGKKRLYAATNDLATRVAPASRSA
jgi:hypothetical protein